MSELTDDFLRDTGRMKRERDWPEPEDIRAMRHPDEAEIAALRRRNERLERVAEAARLAYVAQATLDLEKLLEAEEALDKALADLDKEDL